MSITSLFLTNKTQAVRLARDVAFPPEVREVRIIRDGARRIIVPANAAWDDFFAEPAITLADRVQPAFEVREAF